MFKIKCLLIQEKRFLINFDSQKAFDETSVFCPSIALLNCTRINKIRDFIRAEILIHIFTQFK